MKEIFVLITHLLTTLAKLMKPGGARWVVGESLLLKHQLLVLNRGRKRIPPLSPWDLLAVALPSVLVAPSRIKKLAVILKPSTLLALHKLLVCRKYLRLFTSTRRTRPAPKGPSDEIIAVILELKHRNPRFGCPRIALEITHGFDVAIDKDVVRRVLAKHFRAQPGNGDPSWLTFFSRTKDSAWSVDFFLCESILLKSFCVMVVMDIFTRRIIGFAVKAAGIDGVSVCCMFNHAISNHSLPRYLSSDHAPLFLYHRWRANLRVLDINEIRSVPYTPTSHPFVERLIGTVRRELLDQTFFWSQLDLQRKLDSFKQYYNDARVHSSLQTKTPTEKLTAIPPIIADLKNFSWKLHCNGLFQIPIAA